MQGGKTRAVAVDGEHRASAPTAARQRGPIQGVARQNQSGMRISSIAVGISTRRKTMQGGKARPIGVDLEHCASARTAALRRSPVQGVARQNQSGFRISAVAVGLRRRTSKSRKTMQGGKNCAICVDLEDRAIAGTAAIIRSPIQGVARYNQTTSGGGSVAVGIRKRSRGCGEII